MELSDRMKYYENLDKRYLRKRMPLILRLDGKSFHTFTKKYKKPFDIFIANTMREVTQYLVKEIQGVKIGYTQSDEINLLLTDWDTFETDAWFGYSADKIVSVSAAMASVKFNEILLKNKLFQIVGENSSMLEAEIEQSDVNKVLFDSRAFNLTKEEVVNYFYHRQLDWRRNNIQMLAKHYYSQKELQGKNQEKMYQMIAEKSDTIENYPKYIQYGTFCIRYNKTHMEMYSNFDLKQENMKTILNAMLLDNESRLNTFTKKFRVDMYKGLSNE